MEYCIERASPAFAPLLFLRKVVPQFVVLEVFQHLSALLWRQCLILAAL
jgi:hypothetical protein